jgi:hypothetical protein
MPKLTIIKDDKYVSVDNAGLHLDAVDLPANVHAVQFDGTSGWIEYNDGKPNETIDIFDAYSTIINDHAVFKAAVDKDIADTAALWAEQEKSYWYKREQEYPTIGDQLDMIYHNGDGGAEFQAAIKAVKDKYPK